MAAMFFQGTLGQFMAFSQFGGGGGAPVGSRPGEPAYRGGAGALAQNTEREGNSPVGASGFGNPAANPNYGRGAVHHDVIKRENSSTEKT
jgi:type IV secretion system protein VirB6